MPPPLPPPPPHGHARPSRWRRVVCEAGRRAWHGAWLIVLALAGAVCPVPGQAAEPAGAEETVVTLNQRKIVTLRGSLLDDSAAERAAVARDSMARAVAAGGELLVSRTASDRAVRFDIDGQTVFFLVPEDLAGPPSAAALDSAAQKVEQRLRLALAEAREMRDPRSVAAGAAYAAVATLVAALAAWLLNRLRRRLQAGLRRQLAAVRERPTIGVWAHAVDRAGAVSRLLVQGLCWALFVLLADAWVSYVLRQFAYTRPWGERSTAWLVDLLTQIGLGVVRAVPGLVVVVLVFFIARVVTQAITTVLQRVERGELHLGWIDADTAGATRRVANLLLWLFALVMAYPYLPGSNSEAFKGVSVLAGLMLSLGASSVVGQSLAGLSLMYARAFRVGEYVRIGDTEGTVVSVGLLVTKVHTGLGEEVSLPNAMVFGQTVRNFSRLVADGQFMLQTAVTIGYATPWRQVHALLLEAARRTPGVAQEPAPFVVQTALSDFYVEYRLCAQGNRAAPRRRAEAMNQLHANIQDMFNEHGVQIMSPHYLGDPAQPQVVPKDAWYTAPAVRETALAGGPPVPAPVAAAPADGPGAAQGVPMNR